MSALVPSDAVALLYRRYLKAANRIPNVTIRMLLLQQIRAGFNRNKNITSPSAQRELINQAHKDLLVLEDDRLSRTLYINRLGLVSCLDWEVRRTEYNFKPETQSFISFLLVIGFGVVFYIIYHAERIEQKRPDIAQMVDLMSMRLEADSVQELQQQRERDVRSMLERKEHQRGLEHRILTTFYQAPMVDIPAPSLRNPSGARLHTSPRASEQQQQQQ